jgi:tetratricopeptide (TPR) repeat protein
MLALKFMIAIVASTVLILAATPPGSRVHGAPADSARASSADALRQYAVGRLLEERGDVDGATDLYYRALVADPRAGEVARRISELAARSGDASRSLEFAERAIALDSTDARAHWLAGVALFEQGKREAALASLETSVRADSTHAEYAQALVHVAQEMGRLDVEHMALQRSIEINPDDGEAWFQLAAISARSGKYAEADSALEVATRLNPDRPGTDFLGGWIAESMGRDSLAIVHYRRHLAAHEDDQVTRRRLVPLLARQQRFTEAYAEARKVSRSHDGDLDATLIEAELAFRAKAPDEGEKIITRLAHDHPDDPDLYGRLIGLLARQDRTSEAQALADRWAAAHPADYRGAMLRARAALLANKGPLAIEQGRRAVLLAPDSLETHELLGRIYQHEKKWGQAESLWTAVMRRFPDDSGAVLELSYCREQLGDIDGALRAIRGLLERDADNVEAMNSLGYLLADHGRDLDEAERLIRRALAEEPDNGAFIDSWGWLLFRRGRLDEARVQLERAVSLTGDDPVVREHLGDVYNQLNLKDLAREQYKHSLSRDSSNTRVRAKLAQAR